MRDSDPDINVSSFANLSDGSLLRRLQEGETDAATRIFARYARRLQALAKSQSAKDLSPRVDPEDIVQSVFRTFFRRAKDGHYHIPDGEELWKLLLVITLNKVRAVGAFHRAAKRDVSRTIGSESPAAIDRGAHTSDETPFQILRMVVDELLTRVTTVQKRMVILRIDGHEIGEIAKITQRSKRSVERTLQQFRTLLNDELDKGANRA